MGYYQCLLNIIENVMNIIENVMNIIENVMNIIEILPLTELQFNHGRSIALIAFNLWVVVQHCR